MPICHHCGFANAPDQHLCAQCGAAMAHPCPACGHLAPADGRFCGQCGARLPSAGSRADGHRAPADGHAGPGRSHNEILAGLRTLMPPTLADKITAATAEITGERREVTVMLVDVGDMASLADYSDPEALYLLTDRVMQLLVEVIYEYEGHVDKFGGDGLMALFGAPVAHENDPERAVRAALEIQDRLRGLTDDSGREPLRFPARIGIHTGLVIAGRVGRDWQMEYTVVGDTVHLATRLKTAAAPGTALVSAATYQRTRPVFRFQMVPEIQPGGEVNVVAFRPTALRKKPGRVRGLPGLQAPMIGRDRALAQLRARLQIAARQRQPQVVLITGEAGVGKSRLVWEFRGEAAAPDSAQDPPTIIYEGCALAYARSRPYWMVADLLRNMIGISESDPPAAQFAELEAYLRSLDLWLPEVWPYLAHLLGLKREDAEGQHRLQQVDADVLQKLTHAALRRVLLAEAGLATTVLVFEDLHWIDAASREFLQYFIQGVEDTPLLLLLISREESDELVKGLQAAAHHNEANLALIQLEALDPEHGHLLVEELLQPAAAEVAPLQGRIVHLAGGNPFYTEEIVRILVDEGGVVQQAGVWQVTPRADGLLQQVPGTLRGLILARFDTLTEETRRTLQKGAVLGASFAPTLLQLISEATPPQLQASLDEAEARHFLAVRTAGEETTYAFRHALFQEVIYDTLLRRHRHQLHARAAQAIEAGDQWSPDEKVELLAHHYARSAQREQAVTYLLQAAENAAHRNAHETAVEHHRQVLSLIGDEPEPHSPAYFRARIGLGQSLKLTGAFTEARTILSDSLQAFLRWSIVAEINDLLPLLINGLRELADVYQREGAYEDAISHLEAGIEALGDTGRERHSGLWLTLIERLAFVHMRQGKLDSAFALAHMGTTEVDLRKDQDLVAVANLYNTLGGIAWQQGNLEEAIFYVGQSLEAYERLGYAWGRANAYSNLGVLYAQQGNWQKTLDFWKQALALRQELGDIHSQAVSLANLGQLHLHRGDLVQAEADLAGSLSIFRRLGDNWGVTQVHATLAEMALLQEDLDAAEGHATRALALAREVGSQDSQAHARWIQGLVQARRGQLAAGIQAAEQALALAKEVGATDVEADSLRVLGHLHVHQGDTLEAETRLRESLELCRQINDPFRHGLVLVEMGRLYHALAQEPGTGQLERLERGRLHFREAIDIFGRLEADWGRREAMAALRALQADMPAESAPEEEIPVAQPPVPAGERRTAALLWVRLDVPRRADEEAVFETMTRALPTLTAIVQEYQGHVRQFPNGLQAVFGAPVAHEDDAENAVQAAHHILQHLQEGQYELTLTTHMAVSLGEVVAGQIAHRQLAEFVVLGEPMRQVQQLASLSPSGRIWVTDSIQRLTRRLFTYQPVAVPDLAEQAWELVARRESPGPRRGLPDRQSRFVGRDAPLRQMLSLSLNLSRGLGGLLLIEGEAGIGKSRLMREFAAAVSATDRPIWFGNCSSQRVNHPFHLFSDLLANVFHLQPADTADEIRAKLQQTMRGWPRDAQMTRPYLEMLVGLRPEGLEGERLRGLEPDQLRQQTFVAIRRLLKTLAKRHPLVVILDDLHWIDPISAELLLFVVTMVTSDPIIFVAAQRRQGADLPNDRLIRLQSLLPGQTIRLLLQRLSSDDSQTLVQDLFAGNLPEGIARLIIGRSEGNPYFIEEFVRMFIEQGYVEFGDGRWRVSSEVDLRHISLPSSLDALIRARIDALPPDLKEILQSAAIVGKDFETVLVAQLTGDTQVASGLDRLASRLMIVPLASSGRWQFAHALFESIVYNTMLRTRRQQLHRQVAEILEARWAEDRAEHAEQLAYHFSQAGAPDKAVPYLILAGERAATRYANEEALSHFQAAAESVEAFEQPSKEWQWRVAVGLGDVFRFVGRYEESMTALQSALPLLQAGEMSRERLADIYWRMGETAQAQGEFETARGYFTTALELIGEPDTPPLQVEAARTLMWMAWGHFFQGNLEKARQLCQDSMGHAQAADSISDLAYVENLLGGIYFRLGDWRAALHHTTRAMVLREQMGYTWGVAKSLSNLGILAVWAGHWSKALSFFRRSLDVRQEIGDVEGVTITHNNLGNLYKDQGELEKAKLHFEQSLEQAQLLKMPFHIAQAHAGLAHVHLLRQDLEAAESALAAGIEQARAIDTQQLLAEMHRVQAEILLAQSQFDRALNAAEQAAALAVEAGNLSYEAAGWRVAAEAARQQGDLDAAHAYVEKAREKLSGATDELEAGHVAAQASRVLRQLGEAAAADGELRAARSIFTRLGARLYLEQLEMTLAVEM